jgi:hypothetical protein
MLRLAQLVVFNNAWGSFADGYVSFGQPSAKLCAETKCSEWFYRFKARQVPVCRIVWKRLPLKRTNFHKRLNLFRWRDV